MIVHYKVSYAETEEQEKEDKFNFPLCDFIGDDFLVPFPKFELTSNEKSVNCQECGTEYSKVLESDEVAVKKAKIKRLIVEIEAYPMIDVSKKEFIALIEDLSK
jgi:hypothetical protein